MRSLLSLALLAFASTSYAAPPMVPLKEWVSLAPGGIRGQAAIGDENWSTWSYSSVLHGVVVFGKYHGAGGTTSGEDQNALLSYDLDSNAWSLFAPAEQCGSQDLPGGGHDAGNAVFDTIHQVYLNKGNLTLGCWTDGTYEYDVCSRAGHHVLAADEPAHSESNAGSFDSDHDAWVLFGGQGTDETFVYHHATATWTHSHPNPSPPPRQMHGQVYDRAHHRTIVFGGVAGGVLLTDTWAYDLEHDSWSEITSAVKPSPTTSPSMAYDDVNHVTLLADAQSYVLDLDNGGWIRYAEADLPAELLPQSRENNRLTYDVDDQFFLFLPGNYLDVFAFRPVAYVAGIGTPGGAACGAPIPPQSGVDGGLVYPDGGGPQGDGGTQVNPDQGGGGDQSQLGCSCQVGGTGGPELSSSFLILLAMLIARARRASRSDQ